MSSRSPSPLRRTVIGSSTKADESNRTHGDDLVKLRDRKLVELYCMSRLSELLEIKDEKELKSEINSFLRQNDIRKGLRFQSNTVPKFKQVETPASTIGPPSSSLATGSAANSLSNGQGNGLPILAPSARKSLNTGDGNRRSSETNSDHVTQAAKSNPLAVQPKGRIELKRPLDEVESIDRNPGKRIKSGRDSNDIETKGSSPSSSMSSKLLSAEEISKNESPSLSTTPAPATSNPSAYYMDVDIPSAEPTPLETSKKYNNYLVDEVSKKAIESMDYFNEKNINSKESLYLLMKDVVPSRIAQALPLAELKYMVQTLPLIKLIPMAHKALTTDIMNNALSEGRITVVSSRIEELRRLGLWSLRQPKKFIDAWENDPSHHRTLIEEAKWMQADFKEGQKYKIAVCTTIAHAIMEYWTYGKICCIQTEPISDPELKGTVPDLHDQVVAENTEIEATLEMKEVKPVDSNESHNGLRKDEAEAPEREKGPERGGKGDEGIDVALLLQRRDGFEEVIPPKLSAIGQKDYESHLNNPSPSPFKLSLSFEEINSTVRTIAQDIPLYTGVDNEHEDETNLSFVPVSKSLVKLEYDHFFKLVEKQLIDEEQSLVQLSKRRGMFYGNRRSHYLKPPPAPSLRYLQNRTPTIWLPEDDQDLVKNINAYAYNWELISAHMTHRPSMSYLSNIERRTPWQCFERFVQLNERFSFSDLKGPRAHSVQQWLMEAHKFQQKQNRRISPLGVGPESIQRGHRRLRWASMFEAMRKSIKKRENAPRPNPTQPRKPLDCKNMKVPTPSEMSQLKAQRDEALRRDIQTRRTVKSRLQQRSTQSTPTPAMTQNRASSRGATNALESASSVPNSNHLPKAPTARQTSTPGPQRRLSEREIIEAYSKRILAQKPELSVETAMKAAQSYYRSGQQRKIQLQQQQQRQQNQQAQSQALPEVPSRAPPDAPQHVPQQIPPQASPQAPPQASSQAQPQKPKYQSQNASGQDNANHKVQITSNNLLGANNPPKSKINSPTPQEILERFQK